MIRIFAAILSVYILILSGIACEDQHQGDFVQGSVNTELSADMHTHSSADLCNPFFVCHSGHHTFVGEENFFSLLRSGLFKLSQTYKPDYHFPILFSIWNPPKA